MSEFIKRVICFVLVLTIALGTLTIPKIDVRADDVVDVDGLTGYMKDTCEFVETALSDDDWTDITDNYVIDRLKADVLFKLSTTPSSVSQVEYNLDKANSVVLYWGTCETISTSVENISVPVPSGDSKDYIAVVKDGSGIHLVRIVRDNYYYKVLQKNGNASILEGNVKVTNGLKLVDDDGKPMHISFSSEKSDNSALKSESGVISYITFKDSGSSDVKPILVYPRNTKDNYKNTPNLQYKNIKDLLLNGNISPEETEVLLGMYFEEYLDMSLRYFENSEMQNIFKEIEASGQDVDIPLMFGENSKLVMRLSCTDSTSLEGDDVKSWTTELYFSDDVSTDNSQSGLLKVIAELGVDFKDKISKEDYPLLWNLCAAYYNWQETDEEKAERIDRERLEELESELSSLGDASLFDVYTFLLRNWSVTDSKFYGDAWTKNGQNSSVQAVKNLASIHCDDIVNNQNYTVAYDDGSGTTVLQKVCSPINVDNSKSENSKTSVTSEQYLRLRLMYDIIQTSKSGKSSIDIQGITTSLSNKGITGRLDINNSLVVNRIKIVANANQAAMDMSNVDISELGEIDCIDILNRAEELTRYFIPRVQGYAYDTGMEVVNDESVIHNSSALFGLFPLDDGGKLLYVNKIGINRLPKFYNIQYVDLNSVEAVSAYSGLQYLYTLMELYVYDKVAGDIKEGQWTKAEEVLASDDVEKAVTGIQQQVNVLVKIHGALDNLGVRYTSNSEVSDSMKIFLSYYARLASYQKETVTANAMDNWSGDDSVTDPLKAIFTLDYGAKYLTADYLTGVKLSATYIPLRTNLYDLSSLNELDDLDWVSRFHYGYGFYRKALYMDTNVNAAVDNYVSGSGKGQVSVVTLRDLLQTERDLVLYVDDGYYNADKLAKQLDGYQNRVVNYNKNQSAEDTTLVDKIQESFTNSVTLDVDGLVKTNGKTTYSTEVKNKLETGDVFTSDDEDGAVQSNLYVMNSAEIKEYLNVDSSTENYHDEYSIAQSFAVVSAIYRHNGLYEIVQSESSNQTPVFISSPNLWQLDGIGYTQFLTAYNYLMLKNLQSQLGIDYESTLDLDSPLYIDVYGNILTESGLVVIPAASNATLYDGLTAQSCGYTIYTAGFLTYYNNGQFYLPNTTNVKKYNKESFMQLDSETDTYRVGVARFQGFGATTKRIDFRNVSLSNSEYLQLFMKLQSKSLSAKSLKYNQHIFLVTEVLRGAPIEQIDKEKEGIVPTSSDFSSFEIYLAAKLEKLVNQMLPTQNGNTWISLPNLLFMDNVEYVLLFIFKVLAVLLLCLLVYRLYIDAVDGVLGIKSFGSFILSCVLVLVGLFSVPYLMDLSYYQVNKALLQDEVSYIEMLNIEKEQEGREIGLTSVDPPETSTELYLKVDDVSIPWYELLEDILFHPTTKTVSEAYDEEYSRSLVANLPGMVRKGNGIYIPLSTVYESSVVSYDIESNLLLSGVTETAYASYITPYYIILENLVRIINEYNQDPNQDGDDSDKVVQYETVRQSGGVTRTKGLIRQYFMSREFMEDEKDITGLRLVYDLPVSWSRLSEDSNPTYMQLDRIKRSGWYKDGVSVSQMNDIETYAREFVMENSELLGKITDEAFLKVMAMSIAVKYNQIVGVRNGNAIEIYDVDARDIIRLSVADRMTALKESSKSFARYIFSVGGALGTILTVILVVVYFISSVVKPLCITVILVVMMASLIVRRFIKRGGMTPIEGFVITLAVLCGTNALYGLVLKGSIVLANSGLTSLVSLIIQVVIQLMYIATLVGLTKLVINNWESFGFDVYERAAQHAVGFIKEHNIFKTRTDRYENNYNYTREYRASEYSESREGNPTHSLIGLTSEQYMELLNSRDERRNRNRGRK